MSIDPPTSIEPAAVTNYNTLPDRLESLSNELAIAAKALARSLDISQDAKGTLVASHRQPTVQKHETSSMRRESAANRERQNAISIVARMQTLLTEPTSFIERLANQVSRQASTRNTIFFFPIHIFNSSMPPLVSNAAP